MKALIQRVQHANVTVDGHTVGSIDFGMLAYIGIGRDDNLTHAKKLVNKMLNYRIFENTTDIKKLGKLDNSLLDIQGGLLLVSQFTLMANTHNGRRADFTPAMTPNDAKILFDELVAYAKSQYHHVATGQFGANMQVATINDGPINFILEA